MSRPFAIAASSFVRSARQLCWNVSIPDLIFSLPHSDAWSMLLMSPARFLKSSLTKVRLL